MIVYGHVDHLKLNKIINQCFFDTFIFYLVSKMVFTTILQVASAGCPVIVKKLLAHLIL